MEYERMTGRPCKVADKWEKMGLRAEQTECVVHKSATLKKNKFVLGNKWWSLQTTSVNNSTRVEQGCKHDLFQLTQSFQSSKFLCSRHIQPSYHHKHTTKEQHSYETEWIGNHTQYQHTSVIWKYLYKCRIYVYTHLLKLYLKALPNAQGIYKTEIKWYRTQALWRMNN